MIYARAGLANASSGAAATLAAFDGSDCHHYFQGMKQSPRLVVVGGWAGCSIHSLPCWTLSTVLPPPQV